MAAVALSLIQEFGEACTFSRPNTSTYDPTTGVATEGTESTFTGYCFPDSFTVMEIDGTLVRKDDIKLLVHKITGNEPSVNDKVTFSNNQYRVVNVTKVSTNGDTVLFELQVRR